MAKKGKKKKTRRIPRPRDPFWRARRVLGQRRVDSAKTYRRSRRRATERQAAREPEA